MEDSEIKRLKVFLSEKGYTIASFERLLQWSNGYIVNREKKYNSTLPNRQKRDLYAIFPELSPSWLENGVGDMIRPVPSPQNTLIGSNNVNNNITNSSSLDIMAALEREQQMNLKLIQQYERLLSLYEELAKKNQ